VIFGFSHGCSCFVLWGLYLTTWATRAGSNPFLQLLACCGLRECPVGMRTSTRSVRSSWCLETLCLIIAAPACTPASRAGGVAACRIHVPPSIWLWLFFVDAGSRPWCSCAGSVYWDPSREQCSRLSVRSAMYEDRSIAGSGFWPSTFYILPASVSVSVTCPSPALVRP
jgi:hypothetical protein